MCAEKELLVQSLWITHVVKGDLPVGHAVGYSVPADRVSQSHAVLDDCVIATQKEEFLRQ